LVHARVLKRDKLEELHQHVSVNPSKHGKPCARKNYSARPQTVAFLGKR
jgi:hypothetical protein